jgi:hypothetical protein
VYGQKKEFKNVTLAMDVYKFAHEMQIDCLMTALDEFLFKNISAISVLEVYEFYKLIEHSVGLKTCKEVCNFKHTLFLYFFTLFP